MKTVVVMIVVSFCANAAGADELTVSQTKGQAIFRESCAFCHGERGHATTLLAKRLGQENALLEGRTNLTPELIRHVVRRGINSMPWYRRAELSDQDLDLVTSYLLRANPQ